MAEKSVTYKGKKLKLTPESVDAAMAGAAPTYGPIPVPAGTHTSSGIPLLNWYDVPLHLTGEGLLEWEHLAEYFRDDPDGPRETERVAACSLCEAVEMRALAAESLREDGLVVPGRSESDSKRSVKNAAWSQWRGADTAVRAWASALGVTPNARRRATRSTKASATPADNPFTRSAAAAMNKRTGAES